MKREDKSYYILHYLSPTMSAQSYHLIWHIINYFYFIHIFNMTYNCIFFFLSSILTVGVVNLDLSIDRI